MRRGHLCADIDRIVPGSYGSARILSLFGRRPFGVDTYYSDSERPTMKAITPAAIAIAMLLFSGCSASNVINTGGDTKCKDFVTQDDKKQGEEVSKMLKDKSGADPTNLEISATRLSAMTYCQTIGKPDTKISEAPHG
jgi:acid stress chaperone HdeA